MYIFEFSHFTSYSIDRYIKTYQWTEVVNEDGFEWDNRMLKLIKV